VPQALKTIKTTIYRYGSESTFLTSIDLVDVLDKKVNHRFTWSFEDEEKTKEYHLQPGEQIIGISGSYFTSK